MYGNLGRSPRPRGRRSYLRRAEVGLYRVRGKREEAWQCRWLKPIETIADQCSVIPLGNGGAAGNEIVLTSTPSRHFASTLAAASDSGFDHLTEQRLLRPLFGGSYYLEGNPIRTIFLVFQTVFEGLGSLLRFLLFVFKHSYFSIVKWKMILFALICFNALIFYIV